MSNPEEKAKQLVERFYGSPFINQETAKYCALICVDEIIDCLEAFGYDNAMYDDFETGQIVVTDNTDPSDYWKKVKEKILTP